MKRMKVVNLMPLLFSGLMLFGACRGRNYDKVTSGLTKNEVLNLLGEPDKKTGLAGVGRTMDAESWNYGISRKQPKGEFMGIKTYYADVALSITFLGDKVFETKRNETFSFQER